MKKIGIYGGSFDPVHIGHLITASCVFEERGLDSIVFIPNTISPLKTHRIPASAEHRLKMLQLATADINHFMVNDIELRRGDVSFTLDTIRTLSSPDIQLEMIIGFDNLVALPKWKQPDEIFKLCEIIVLKRTTDTTPETNDYFSRVTYLNTPVIDISSTEIRDRVSRGKSIKYLVTEAVLEYISRNNLYRQ